MVAKNIFGPFGPGINESTIRPAAGSSGTDTDSWFTPCIDGDPNTGTKVSFRWLNFITANLRRAVRGMGVADDDADDELLLKAIRAASSNNVEAWLRNQPMYPEALTASNVLSVTATPGQLVVDAGQSWLWRGYRKFSSSDLAPAERTLATSASRTYHLRWHAPGTGLAVPEATYPNGRFVLRDLADVAYNPIALAEANASFDSGYDDMLSHLVVTNASNVATLTALANKVELLGPLSGAPRDTPYPYTADVNHYYNFTIAWARTPRLMLRSQRAPGISHDSDYVIEPSIVTRTAIQIYGWTWHWDASQNYASQSPGFSYEMRA